MNVLLGWRNRIHSVSQNQVEHICLQDQCENPENQRTIIKHLKNETEYQSTEQHRSHVSLTWIHKM